MNRPNMVQNQRITLNAYTVKDMPFLYRVSFNHKYRPVFKKKKKGR